MVVLIGMMLAASAQGATPAQPSAQIVAQALDRCMATYAVRLTKTDATDEAIFAEATRECAPLNKRLTSALAVELPPAQAAEIGAQLTASAKPNFMAMLAKIRSDRAARPQN